MPTPRPRMSSRSSDRLTTFCATPARSGVLWAVAHRLKISGSPTSSFARQAPPRVSSTTLACLYHKFTFARIVGTRVHKGYVLCGSAVCAPGVARAAKCAVLHKQQQHGRHRERLAAQVQHRLRRHRLRRREPCAGR